MLKKVIRHVNTKTVVINLMTAMALNIYLEWMERKSAAAVLAFMQERTFLFFYNFAIIFLVLSPVLLFRKKYFIYCFLTGICFLIGTVNGVILDHRNTPFTAVDLTIAKSAMPIVKNYYSLWQIILGILGLIAVIVIMVCLFLYTPESRKEFTAKSSWLLILAFLGIFSCITLYGKEKDILHRHFDNLIIGYEQYGVAYSFTVTFCDTGIRRPLNYSRSYVNRIIRKTDRKVEQKKKKEGSRVKANIIFIQLESFFDITTVKGLHCDTDPLPTLHALQKEYPHGRLSVPVYGAGTINTEFEVISGMNTDYFGTGEYPYRSILHKTQCDSMAYWMKKEGYVSTVIHNNNASFYDRNTVFPNMGFDGFISSENMNLTSFRDDGWAKDDNLTHVIMDTLDRTTSRDYIYTISVQGHGEYPTEKMEEAQIHVTTDSDNEEYNNQVEFYTNQIHEMDAFIKKLIEHLGEYSEPCVLVFYGDHLPSLGFESENISGAGKFHTPYLIWDNFNYCNGEGTSGADMKEDLQAWQLSAKVLGLLHMNQGVLNRFHQTMADSTSYRKYLRVLQYDLLYGGRFSLGSEQLMPTELTFSYAPIRISEIKYDEKHYYLIGEGFTAASRVYVKGIEVPTTVNSSNVLMIPMDTLSDEDEITVHQVSETNSKMTLNESEIFVFKNTESKPLYRNRIKEMK